MESLPVGFPNVDYHPVVHGGHYVFSFVTSPRA